jgi:hypothetical protein
MRGNVMGSAKALNLFGQDIQKLAQVDSLME